MATVMDRRYNNRDEHSQTGILTSASNRLPAFPIRFGGTWGICSRYSGATVPDFHRVPRHLTAMTDEQRSSFSKNSSFLRSNEFLPRKIFGIQSLEFRLQAVKSGHRLKAELQTSSKLARRRIP
jgi:hypothetical protein